MEPEVMNKIQGLFQTTRKEVIKGKKYKFGPYWTGWWMEDGKQIVKYIGKKLPKELEYLRQNKFKLPGRKRWAWPQRGNSTTQDTETRTP